MISKTFVVLAMAALMAPLMGCAGVYSPAQGGIWMDVKGPLHAGDKVGSKEGRACATSYVGLVAMGDASIQTAAANGGITNIESVDHHSKNMVVIGEFCTIVRGS